MGPWSCRVTLAAGMGTKFQGHVRPRGRLGLGKVWNQGREGLSKVGQGISEETLQVSQCVSLTGSWITNRDVSR